ncbi:MAG: hypothetical protein KJP10_10290 [Gammaproteobacteria bacterium]|nr:hypothetical protein [Gammaproteobacteria bacterium]
MVFADVTRKQAFLTHLIISLAIFFVLLYLIVFQWYPSYYFHVDGGYRGIATIFFVDVVLGPLLTLLVFKPGKPGLKFDMAVIIMLQVVALYWGIKSVYMERPMLTVFYNGKFSCLSYSETSDFDLERLSLNDIRQPLLAVLPRPNTYTEYQEMMLEAFKKSSAEIYMFSEKLLPMDAVGTVHLMNYKLDVPGSFYGDDEEKEKYTRIWSQYLENNPGADQQYLFYPLACRYNNVLAVFDPQSSAIVDFVPVYTNRAESTVKLGFSKDELEQMEEIRRQQKLENNGN